ncbi:MAG: HAMP domain-containing histidine kinase [Lachnospiraceae bacterium]|nr:HAMP domain-containing histidine kinase [Lachnospiraceae bacterium]
MYLVIGILSVISGILLMYIWHYQRQVKNICRQLAFIKKYGSNQMIVGLTGIGTVDELAEILNDFLDIRKRERKEYLDKEKLVSDIYMNLSHDIRTPLTSLDGYFQLLSECEDEDRERYLAVIQERIGSLKDMLEELFTFTKLKNGDYHLEMSKIYVNRILKDTIFSYYEDWLEHGIEPKIEIDEGDFIINGNEQALRRVIQNILKNAVDHGKKKILIFLKTDVDKVVLKIGNLVSNADQIDVRRVFERFYKMDSSRSRNSTGLGLSIAREFVLQMGGRIEADVEGVLFWIRITFEVCK